MPDNNHPPVSVPMVPVPNPSPWSFTGGFKIVNGEPTSLTKLMAEFAALTAENERLRADLREAVGALAKIADHGKGFTDEQMHLRIYAATYYRWAKSEADAVVAKHRKGESDVL